MIYIAETSSIIAFIYPDLIIEVDYIVYNNQDGTVSLEWITQAHPQPSEQDILDNAKPWSAALKQEQIYKEQELRSATVYGEKVSRHFFAWIEEFYTEILLPAARNNITEANTPITYGLKALRDNRNTMLAGLQAWVDDPTKTYEDILAFDVAGWSGWDVARPD